ncbi:hypothetical protein [Catenulispora rubra]|nr:hypothetical protein [Catenulispora rubra]
MLPEEFSDEARLALIDIDPTDAMRGAIWRWSPETSAWEKDLPEA